MMMPEATDADCIDLVIRQGRALVHAIDALGKIEPSSRFERWQARLLQVEYRHRLREILRIVPAWMAEQILSASKHIGDDRAAVGISNK
jgi:hypothetical protein